LAKQEYRHNSVEFKELGEVVKTIIPPRKLTKEGYCQTGKYPIVDQGQKFIVAYTNDETAILDKDEYIIFGDHTKSVKFVNFAFAQGADGVKIFQPKNISEIMPKYLYYFVSNTNITSKGYNRHWAVVKLLKLSIPPIDEQQRIVAILDKFDKLVCDISEGLPAELNARRKQYEYYRDKLLTFKEITHGKTSCN
jgi:type I restriction enzyme S subunit